MLQAHDSGREWNARKVTSKKPWRSDATTPRKYYRRESLEDDYDPWEGNILDAPPGALPKTLRRGPPIPCHLIQRPYINMKGRSGHACALGFTATVTHQAPIRTYPIELYPARTYLRFTF